MPYRKKTNKDGEEVWVKVPSKLEQVCSGDKVGKEVIDEFELNEIEIAKIKMVVKLLRKTARHKRTGETTYEYMIWYQKHILMFIREWDNALANWDRSMEKLEKGVFHDGRYK